MEPRRNEDDEIVAQPLTEFYAECPDYYFREFANEHKVQERDRAGNIKYIWKPVTAGAPTHSLDTAVLCAAAGFYKGVQYLKKKSSTGGARKTGGRRIGRVNS